MSRTPPVNGHPSDGFSQKRRALGPASIRSAVRPDTRLLTLTLSFSFPPGLLRIQRKKTDQPPPTDAAQWPAAAAAPTRSRRNRECRMCKVNYRQSEAVGGGREDDGAVVPGRKMGVHGRLQMGRAAAWREINRLRCAMVLASALTSRAAGNTGGSSFVHIS